MFKKFIKFDGNEIEKYKCHQHKSPITINNIDNKIVVADKASFGKKRN